ncbi:MAG: thymidylate kinase [Methylotenera sp.]|nr:thymidylate kinase [Methylotenera sp.]MSP99807.1 thymidylate kinase [Methylotenera sp.]
MKKRNDLGLAPLIAIIGCDGSGKSTVSAEILIWMQGYGPVVAAHLGKQMGNIGRTIAKLPLVGKLLDQFIVRKTKSTQAHREKKTPGLFVALILYVFSMRRLRRFKHMTAQRRQGLIVVTDRYPQLEFPGAFDGTGLSISAPGNFLVRWLARRERAQCEWMTSFRPDLVIRLNVDLDTACARKPDHRRELLRDKVAITPQLTFNGAPIVEIDSTKPLAQVLAEAKAAVAKTLAERGYTQSNS